MLSSPRKTATLRDVAALAGIDKATASRALNGKGYISPETRDAAFKAAQELGYQPNLHALRLKVGRCHNTIALLTDHDLGVLSRQTFFTRHRLAEYGFEVQLHSIPRWVLHTERMQFELVDKVRREIPGAIVSASGLAPEALQQLELFIRDGGVVVTHGEKIDLECDQVPFDFLNRAYLATRHLLELGHREIGFCLHGEVVDLKGADIVGFSRAMEEFGASIQEDWIFGGGNYEEGGARLAEAFLGWANKPTGMCIVNDASASAFVTAVSRNGVVVPDDISVVGFDDDPRALYALVPLTTVNYPLETVGRHVVEFTQSRLNGYDGPPRTVVVQSELITRSSTAPYRSRGVARIQTPSVS